MAEFEVVTTTAGVKYRTVAFDFRQAISVVRAAQRQRLQIECVKDVQNGRVWHNRKNISKYVGMAERGYLWISAVPGSFDRFNVVVTGRVCLFDVPRHEAVKYIIKQFESSTPYAYTAPDYLVSDAMDMVHGSALTSLKVVRHPKGFVDAMKEFVAQDKTTRI